ncbi:hypothetical protein D9619_012542 [Psilocybe cf. subviscida]|uniref:Uncharacterized protein n=1 Tax=Psilocybe cf. subviscida TaxID=2480587 RepID=A0A8H5B8V3_9AGAR|nr:hypothetical protein D9619_012542 [Psilocybe cf. subviscida]
MTVTSIAHRNVDAGDRFKTWVEHQSINELFSLVRIAKMLKFKAVVDLCADRLEMELPRTLDAFDAAYDAEYAIPKHGHILKATSFISSKAELFSTINLLLELDRKRALACAYVIALMEASLEDIENGVATSEGSPVKLCAKAHNTLNRAHGKIYPMLLREFSDSLLSDKYRPQYCVFPVCQDASDR